jgi:hypothetical protein
MQRRHAATAIAAGLIFILSFAVSPVRAANAPARGVRTTTGTSATTTATTRTTTRTTTRRATVQSDGWIILFRADDPLLWNTDSGNDPAAPNGYAITLDKAPQDVTYLRIKRMDNGDALIVPMAPNILLRKGELPGDYFWNSMAEPYTADGKTNRVFGLAYKSWNADHTGQHFVTRFTRRQDAGWRGWGFSKQANPDQAQTYSWAGKPIDKTVFEIAIKTASLTDDERDQLISVDRPPRPGSNMRPPTTIARNQTSIHGLTVSFTETRAMLGGTTDLILTATPASAPRENVPVTFVRPVGEQMTAVLADVLRCVRLKHPKWEASKVEISFDDRTSKMDGASIGAACGTMILSMLEGYEIDPNLAMTGDVTADGKVRKIGGVAAKIRAATNSKCAIVALPADNYDQVADALVYEGAALLSRIQVIGIGTLDDAAAVARVDRAERLARAIELFADVQATLKKSPDQIRMKPVREKLSEITEIAPNHYSAKLLLLVATQKQPRRLSSGATLYYMAVAMSGVKPALLNLIQATDRQKIPPVAITDGIKTLDRLRRIADPPMIPLVDAYREFIKAVADAQAGAITLPQLKARIKAVEDAETKVKANRDMMEKMLREGV